MHRFFARLLILTSVRAGILGMVCTALLLVPLPAEAKDPAVRYMERVANELVKAGRLSSRQAFYKSILRHADTRDIGTYSLGIYLPNLKNSKKKSYYEGVRRFVARYFATQSRKYHVSRVEIISRARKPGLVIRLGKS